ncbi:class I SAM-dependent methyltransferase [Clostridium sp. SHJSY1]|uniref:tRNA (mnm(5)s(2)U34)-methyltransferase n=1 Tax=Clostridium sp. SHJSY1 TaxID=2942483 RepID=UPI002876F581|nr:class I SAM-dependent methyltransferase [Clostridium sp. SHJSY1]MDS0524447.1 class I SAM-dependent methyltransferase [Clostridium sp. SHJSY1]
MFKYVGDISELVHYIIKEFLVNKKVAIDGTLGNGYDTEFLAKYFEKVYAFDIQKEACENFIKKEIQNVNVINDSHHLLTKHVKGEVDCIVYNLGFLPGGDKNITTNHNTSLKSIKEGLNILSSSGVMAICIYTGHCEGKKEETCILEYLETLPKSQYGVMLHSYLNRSNNPPKLVIIEKK